jgi:hypothetical protein
MFWWNMLTVFSDEEAKHYISMKQAASRTIHLQKTSKSTNTALSMHQSAKSLSSSPGFHLLFLLFPFPTHASSIPHSFFSLPIHILGKSLSPVSGLKCEGTKTGLGI